MRLYGNVYSVSVYVSVNLSFTMLATIYLVYNVFCVDSAENALFSCNYTVSHNNGMQIFQWYANCNHSKPYFIV